MLYDINIVVQIVSIIYAKVQYSAKVQQNVEQFCVIYSTCIPASSLFHLNSFSVFSFLICVLHSSRNLCSISLLGNSILSYTAGTMPTVCQLRNVDRKSQNPHFFGIVFFYAIDCSLVAEHI